MGTPEPTARPYRLRWDGLYRCEDHPAGTHLTIEEAEACIQGVAPAPERELDVERLARALAHCIGYLQMESPTLEGSYWTDRAEAIAAAYANGTPADLPDSSTSGQP